MLNEIFARLDRWVSTENESTNFQGLPALPKSVFRVVGQTALLEANLEFAIAATVDVDILNNAKYEVLAKLNELLIAEGLELDPLSNEIWMPEETNYIDLYQGEWIHALLAEPQYIMVSKALKSPSKNKVLLRQYIAHGPHQVFFDLCEKYKINLQSIVRG